MRTFYQLLTNKASFPNTLSVIYLIMKIPNNISTGEMAVVLRAKSQKDDRSRLTQEERDWFLSAARMIEYLEKEVERLRSYNTKDSRGA